MTTPLTRLRRGPAVLAAATLSFTLLAGCGTQEDAGESAGEPGSTSEAAPTTEDPTSEEPTVQPTPPDDSGATRVPPAAPLPTGDVPPAVAERDQVRQAVADLSERLGVDGEAVTVAGFREVTWRDGSLGCPEPGMMYTQALVPGQQLVLEVDGQLHAYHAASGKEFRYCANPQEPAPGEGGATM